jgi:hypothetical protein
MTKRDFFRVIIKLFGLFQLLIVIFQGVPQFLQLTAYSLEASSFFFGSLLFGLTIGIFVLLIYKVDTIIDWLKLDTGFDEDRIQFENFNSLQIIKLGLILISGVMILNHFPNLLSQSYLAFKNSASTGLISALGTSQYAILDYYSWAISGLNVVLGYLLIANYKTVAIWLDNKTTIKNND